MNSDHPVHPASLSVERLLADCHLQPVRRSGPGGQHRNKVQSGIVITHAGSGVTAEASERRSQADNRRVAVHRLRIHLALAVRSEASEPQPPSDLWKSRVHGGRIAVNPQHEDFPSLLAEALDILAGNNWEPRSAAAHLGCSSSQLLKLLRLEPASLLLVNNNRQALGWHPLK